MTYSDLKQILDEMTEVELAQTVTCYLNQEDEFIAVSSVLVSDDREDRLDPGHIYLSV